jgi:deoxyribonuclease V
VKTKRLHPWNVTPAEAREIQKKIAEAVSTVDDFTNIKRVAGVDVGYKNNRARAAIVVFGYPELEILDYEVSEGAIGFPYVPGLLSFREIPPLLQVVEKLRTHPDLVIADGQGIAHPLRLGVASHLGVLTGIPTIGCAKSRLIGTYQEPGEEKGSSTFLYDNDEIIGAVVRTRSKVSPVYVSCGHKISLESAVEYILSCTTKFRLPEPIRSAHRMTLGQRLTFL